MAKTSAAPRVCSTVRCSNIWFKNWSEMPKPNKVSLPAEMKKLLIKYPKGFSALSSFTLSALKRPIHKNAPNFTRAWKKMYKNIMARYKAGLFKHIDIDIPGLERSMVLPYTNLKSLKIHQFAMLGIRSKSFFLKLMKQSRRLQTVEISSDKIPPCMMVECLQYVKSLKRLTIHNFPFLSSRLCRSLMSAVGSQLQSLTITGALEEDYVKNTEQFLLVLSHIYELPKLKEFRYDAEVPDHFDVNYFQFDKLRAKKIRYDIRVTHAKDTLTLSETNASSLEEVDFLGINTKKEWLTLSSNWDVVQEGHLKLQKESRNLLFLNLYQMKDFINLTSLLQGCRNIQTLDLILSELNPVMIDFSALRLLSRLKNLYVQFHTHEYFNEHFFSNLQLCVQEHRTLTTLYIGFFGGVVLNDYVNAMPFFEACADVVTTFIVQFAAVFLHSSGIDCMYKGIEKLTNLKTLGIYVSGLCFRKADFEDVFQAHTNNLERIFDRNNSLENFYFISPHMNANNVYLDLMRATNLKGLALGLAFTDSEAHIMSDILKQTNLTTLDLKLTGNPPDQWVKIVKSLRTLKQLEVVRLREVKGLDKPALRDQLETLSRTHPQLDHLLFGDDDGIQVLLCNSEYFENQVDLSVWSKMLITPVQTYEERSGGGVGVGAGGGLEKKISLKWTMESDEMATEITL